MDYYVITLQILCNKKKLYMIPFVVIQYYTHYTMIITYPVHEHSGFGVPAGFSFLVLMI